MNKNAYLRSLIALILSLGFFLNQVSVAQAANCGQAFLLNDTCPANCPAQSFTNSDGARSFCCGPVVGTQCNLPPCPIGQPFTFGECTCNEFGSDGNGNTICQGAPEWDPNPANELTQETLDSFNPLVSQSQGVDEDLSKPGGILSRVLRFAFPLAGLILFVMLVWSGFEIIGGAAEKKSLDAGKQRATAAVIGFLLLFVSYWLAQLLEVIFGITIF